MSKTKKPPAKMGRPIKLAKPIASLAKLAGGVQQLATLCGAKSPSTVRRWSDALKLKHPLPTLVAKRLELVRALLEGKSK